MNSSLPASISNIKTHLERTEKFAKLLAGPTAFRPGPILFTQVKTLVKFVVKSNPLNEIIIKEIIMMMILLKLKNLIVKKKLKKLKILNYFLR